MVDMVRKEGEGETLWVWTVRAEYSRMHMAAHYSGSNTWVRERTYTSKHQKNQAVKRAKADKNLVSLTVTERIYVCHQVNVEEFK